MKATILTIGNEILKGRTVNTNLAHIGRVLTYAGYEVFRAMVVMDTPDDISWGIRSALSFSDFIVTTGGLGPTFDDMTVESISMALGIDLEVNSKAFEALEKRYRERDLDFTEARLKMARLPKGADAILNPVGSAPGVILRHEGKTILMLPGVPGEMEALLDIVLDRIRVPGRSYYEETVTLRGIMESSLAPLIIREMKAGNGKIYIKSHPGLSEASDRVLEVEISSADSTETLAKENVKRAMENIRRDFRSYIGK